MILSVSNSPAFAARMPKPKKSWIPKGQYQQQKIDQLTSQIDIINRDTDNLYKMGYDVSGRLSSDARNSIAQNESQIERIKSQIDWLKQEIAMRIQK
ncbi:MAG: hypothetical protein NC200_08300 [Candidatus Gastranaerophilales bacterium]|nr:hypothetical protein [Candidatus Gastranaerophilales bacterium]